MLRVDKPQIQPVGFWVFDTTGNGASEKTLRGACAAFDSGIRLIHLEAEIGWSLEVLQSDSLRDSGNKIVVLDRLTGGTLAKVILGALKNKSSGAGVMMPTNIDIIGPGDILSVGGHPLSTQSYKRSVCIGCFESLAYVAEVSLQLGKGGGANSGGDGDKVRHKGNRNGLSGRFAEFLLDLREMPVSGQAIRAHAFVDLGKDE